MKPEIKIKKQARELAAKDRQIQQMFALMNHLNYLIKVMNAGLSYIAGASAEEKSNIILLNREKPERQDPVEVAQECLGTVFELHQEEKARRANEVTLSVVDQDDDRRSQLPDGGEIVFSTNFDVLYHECCGCGLLHEVKLEWDPSGTLTTKWFRKDRMPTEEEVLAAGGSVINKEDLN